MATSQLKISLLEHDINLLMSCSNFREFILCFMSIKSKTKKVSYADIARRAGFAARSFPREVVLGKKKITLNSLPKLILGLGLTGDIAQYFRYLVELEQPECRSQNKSDLQIQQALLNLKKRILIKNKIIVDPKKYDADIFSFADIPLVYAALGNTGTGSTVVEIMKKSNLSKDIVLNLLKRMISSEIVKESNHRYMAIDHHLNLQGLGQSEIFKSFYIELLKKAQLSAQLNMQNENELHFSSCFSVNQKDLPQLKENLRSLLLQYVDQNEIGAGNKIVKIACSLF